MCQTSLLPFPALETKEGTELKLKWGVTHQNVYTSAPSTSFIFYLWGGGELEASR